MGEDGGGGPETISMTSKQKNAHGRPWPQRGQSAGRGGGATATSPATHLAEVKEGRVRCDPCTGARLEARHGEEPTAALKEALHLTEQTQCVRR